MISTFRNSIKRFYVNSIIIYFALRHLMHARHNDKFTIPSGKPHTNVEKPFMRSQSQSQPCNRQLTDVGAWQTSSSWALLDPPEWQLLSVWLAFCLGALWVLFIGLPRVHCPARCQCNFQLLFMQITDLEKENYSNDKATNRSQVQLAVKIIKRHRFWEYH